MKLQNLVYSRYSGFVFFPRSVYALPGRAANLSLPETCMRWPATVLDMIEHPCQLVAADSLVPSLVRVAGPRVHSSWRAAALSVCEVARQHVAE